MISNKILWRPFLCHFDLTGNWGWPGSSVWFPSHVRRTSRSIYVDKNAWISGLISPWEADSLGRCECTRTLDTNLDTAHVKLSTALRVCTVQSEQLDSQEVLPRSNACRNSEVGPAIISNHWYQKASDFWITLRVNEMVKPHWAFAAKARNDIWRSWHCCMTYFYPHPMSGKRHQTRPLLSYTIEDLSDLQLLHYRLLLGMPW